MNIRTEYVYPPIPIRAFDWSAVDDDSYDAVHPRTVRGRIERGWEVNRALEQIEDRSDEVRFLAGV